LKDAEFLPEEAPEVLPRGRLVIDEEDGISLVVVGVDVFAHGSNGEKGKSGRGKDGRETRADQATGSRVDSILEGWAGPGNVRRNSVYWDGRLSTSMIAPWLWRIWWVMERPRPIPFPTSFEVKK